MTVFQNTQIALSVNAKTMSSREIADVVDKRHDNVKRTIETLAKQGVIQLPQIEEVKNHLGQTVQEYQVNERDSYIVVAQLCPEFTAKLVDYWQATKNNTPAIPQNYAQAMRLAADLYEQNEQLAIERDHAIRTKAQISDRKTATALNTASQATKKANKLQAELGRCTSNATVVAVNKLTGNKYDWLPLRKWCKAQGIKAIEVVDARYGLVKAWPSAAWSAVFGVDLDVLFGEVV